MNYLYILTSLEKPCYKVGITNNMEKRLSKIVADFGQINKEDSFVYSCKNRQLVTKIEFGIHAYLNNYSYSPLNLGGGSTEWFDLASLEKCKWIIEQFNQELSEFTKLGSLSEFLKMPTDFDKIFSEFDATKDFHKLHNYTIETLDKYISKNYTNLRFEKEEGYLALINSESIDLESPTLPKYNWVKIEQNKILFDIKVYNKWKKDRVHNELRDLIQIKFFSKFTLTNLESMFAKITTANNGYNK